MITGIDIRKLVKYLIVKSTLRDWIKRYKTSKSYNEKQKTALELLKQNEQLTMN